MLFAATLSPHQIRQRRIPTIRSQSGSAMQRPTNSQNHFANARATQDTGNKISRRSQIHGTPNIILAGKSVIQAEVIIRGDLVRAQPSPTPPAPSSSTTTTSQQQQQQQQQVSISLGRYVFISPSCILRPPSRLLPNPTPTPSPTQPSTILHHYPLKLESHIIIAPNTVIQAAQIGSHVSIGRDCVVGNMVIIKDYVRVLDGSHLVAGSVWPSFSVVAGRPARVVGEVGEGWGVLEGGPGGESRERWRGVRTGAAPGGR